MNLGLEGKVAIVTGGARGMGRACVEGFVKEGANAVIADVNVKTAEELARKLSRDAVKVLAVKTDVSQKAEVSNVVSKAMEEFGKIDILVNNAGIGAKLVKLVDLEEEQWDLINDINVKGVYLMTRSVLPHMMAARYGKIINFSSYYGKEGFPLAADYCASKFAVIAITQAVAKEYAEYNINVNAVCPGIIRTDIWEEILDTLSQRTGKPREQLWEETVAGIPLKRPQTAQDVANVVLFLSSDISRNITGESISINGGLKVD
jgi:NAD(P)-dependent dehydrogenase (short-subunit alcohol dehydrogenase family)